MTRLHPGVHPVPRDDDHLQVGLDPPHRVIVRRRPDLVALLDSLVDGRPVATRAPDGAHLLRALDEAGLLEAPAPPRLGTVSVIDHGLGLGGLSDLLGAAGLVGPAAGRPPDLYVVGSPGPLPRATLDGWLGEGAPHLLLTGTGRPGSLRLGPLVEPGVTACLRCIDAHESTHDPRRTLVVEQLAGLTAGRVDPVILAHGVAWAARESRAFLSGVRPLTWSATVDLDGPAPVIRSWERHPHCGCA